MNNSQAENSTLAIIKVLQLIIKDVNLYGSFVVLIPCFFLNILALYIFTRPRFWSRTTMGLYFVLNTIFCNLAVFYGIIYYLSVSFGHDLSLKSEFLCKFMWFARVEVIYGSCYFTIFVTLDRTLNMLYFNRIPFLKKYRNILLVTLAIQVVVVLINLLQWWRHLVGSSPTFCILSSILTTVFSFKAILSRILPSACNLTMNLIMVRVLVRSKQAVSARSEISKKEYHFAISLIAQNFVFFLITFPLVVIGGIQISLGLNGQAATLYGIEVSLLFNLTSWGTFLYEAISPFWMNLIFNKLFRAELRSLLFKRINSVNTTKTSPGNNTHVHLSQVKRQAY